MPENELSHHGILGMRWGVRRTPAQLARHSPSKISSNKRKEEKEKNSSNARSLYLNRKDYTLDELKRHINQLETEAKVRDLAAKDLNLGLTVAKKVLEYGGTAIAAYVLGKKIAEAALEVASKVKPAVEVISKVKP